jgi:YHS domain-containing protein
MEVTMTRFAKIVLILSIVAFGLSLAIYAQQPDEEVVTCPVSGEKIKKSEAKGSLEYEGKTYYFCCENCQAAFEKDPERYINQENQEGHMHAHQHGEEQGQEKQEGTVVDPVCGMKIEKSEAKATYEYNGKTYYFCTDGCKEKFVQNPENYLKEETDKVTCPVMGHEIEKSSAAGSMEYNGKTYYFCCMDCKEKFEKNPEKYIKK